MQEYDDMTLLQTDHFTLCNPQCLHMLLLQIPVHPRLTAQRQRSFSLSRPDHFLTGIRFPLFLQQGPIIAALDTQHFLFC